MERRNRYPHRSASSHLRCFGRVPCVYAAPSSSSAPSLFHCLRRPIEREAPLRFPSGLPRRPLDAGRSRVLFGFHFLRTAESTGQRFAEREGAEFSLLAHWCFGTMDPDVERGCYCRGRVSSMLAVMSREQGSEALFPPACSSLGTHVLLSGLRAAAVFRVSSPLIACVLS